MSFVVLVILGVIALGICSLLLVRELKKRKVKKE